MRLFVGPSLPANNEDDMDPITNRINELRQRAAQALAEARSLVEAAEGEDRDLTDPEQTQYDELMSEAEGLRTRAERMETQREAQQATAEIRSSVASGGQPGDSERAHRPETGSRGDSPETFRDLRDFFMSAMFRQNDPRLQDLYAERVADRQTAENRDQSMGIGEQGGFAVPEQFRPQLLSEDPENAIIRPRATVIPAGSPPDAKITMPALDQGEDRNMYGGVEVTWINEGATKPDTSARLRQISLEPQEVAANIAFTDKLLRNWQAAAATGERLLRGATVAAEEAKFIAGSGVGTPLGYKDSGATLSVARQTANDVEYEDVVAMMEQSHGSSLVWIGTKRVKGRFMRMKDEDGRLIWQPNASAGSPGTVLGAPFLEYHRGPQLGNRGDLSLVDLSYYLIKDGSGPFVAAGHSGTDFKDNRTRIKIFWNVDGQPWLHSPFQMDNGDKQSPFVVLDVPEES